MAEMTVAASDGARLAVTLVGDGPPLLLIPGLGAARVVFDPIVPRLAERFTVAVYDQRGIGASELTDGPYTTEQLGDDAAAVLAGLGLDRSCVLGASFGGMVAQQLAVRHPARVARLVLAATGPGRAHLVRPPDPAATAALMGRGARSPEDAYRLACTVLYSPAFSERHRAFIDNEVRNRAAHPIAARAFQAQRAASDAHDAWSGLGGLDTPTLVVHGELDVVMPLDNARALAGHIPGAELTVCAGAGHLFFHEQPGFTADVVGAFAGDD